MHSLLHSRMSRWFLAGAFLVFAQTTVAETLSVQPSTEPISIIQTDPISHPFKLLKEGIRDGWIKVGLGVDETGKLLDALVLGYSQPEFVQPTLDALHHWKFIPAKMDGKAVSTVTPVNFNFHLNTDGVVVTLASPVEYVSNLSPQSLQSLPEENQLVPLERLDVIPVPLHIVSPAYSAENAKEHSGEKVTVRFYIDKKGGVRLPTLIYADNPEIARQALAAVAQWRFHPPTYQGKPVITRASQEFHF